MLETFLAISLHLGIGDGWNNIHPGIRYRQDWWTVGAYYNSERRVSAYTSATMNRGDWFAEAGLVTGYADAELLPFIRSGVHLNENQIIFVGPAYGKGHDRDDYSFGVILGVEFSF